MDYDWETFDAKGYCVLFRARYTAMDSQNEGAGVFTAAYRVSDKVRVCTFLDYRASEKDSAGLKQGDTMPTVGAFAAYSHSGNATGLQAKASAAYNSGRVTVTRLGSIADNTEAGLGKAGLNSYAVGAELGWGFAVGLSSDRTKINNDTASNNDASLTGTAYVSWQATKRVFVDGLMGYGRMNFSSSRYDTNAASSITGSGSGAVFFGSVIASYEQQMGAFKYAPYGGFNMLMGRLNAYIEAGDANGVLSYAAASVNSQGLILGFRGQYDIAMVCGTLSPIARVQFRHGTSGNVTQSVNYAADASANYGLSISGIEQNSITSSIGLRALSKAGPSGQLEYLNNALMRGRQSNGLRGMLMIPF